MRDRSPTYASVYLHAHARKRSENGIISGRTVSRSRSLSFPSVSISLPPSRSLWPTLCELMCSYANPTATAMCRPHVLCTRAPPRSLSLSVSRLRTRPRTCILRAVRERYRKRQLNVKQRERSDTGRSEISNLERVFRGMFNYLRPRIYMIPRNSNFPYAHSGKPVSLLALRGEKNPRRRISRIKLATVMLRSVTTQNETREKCV